MIHKCALGARKFHTRNKHFFPFNGLRSLTNLGLHDNQISELRQDMWQGLPSLKRLKLGKNYIHSIPRGTFSLVPTLESLDFDNNYFIHIVGDWFEGLASLTYLNLKGNELSRINDDMWIQVPSITVLLLDHNLISRIDTGAFAPLPQLKTLHLSNNKLQIITPAMFLELTQMERLNLEQNNIQHILPGTFAGMTKLEALRLGHNNLTIITDDMITASRSSTCTSFTACQMHLLPPWKRKVPFSQTCVFLSVVGLASHNAMGHSDLPHCETLSHTTDRFPSGHVTSDACWEEADPKETTEYGQKAGDMLATGIFSCYHYFSIIEFFYLLLTLGIWQFWPVRHFFLGGYEKS